MLIKANLSSHQGREVLISRYHPGSRNLGHLIDTAENRRYPCQSNGDKSGALTWLALFRLQLPKDFRLHHASRFSPVPGSLLSG